MCLGLALGTQFSQELVLQFIFCHHFAFQNLHNGKFSLALEIVSMRK